MKNNNAAIRAARVASNMTQEQAAKILNISVPTYSAREKLPKSFVIEELEDLHRAFSDQGKKIIVDFVEDIFLPIEEK